MKNVLVYLYKSQLAPKGGPYGYNYNLIEPLEKMGVENIHFIESKQGDASGINNKVNSIKISWLKNVVTIAKSIVRKSRIFYGGNHCSVVDLNQYDMVHFHTVASMYECRDSLKDYKGKILLTTHAPNRPSTSYFEMLSPFEQKYMKWFYKKVFEMDTYAFNRADIIIFPCEDAEEPYYHNWKEYAAIKEKNKDKYRYFVTGINKCTAKISREQIRERMGIPNDAFVICYVGRHNAIKGYDTLKEIGVELLRDPNTYFLIAGREEPMSGLKHDHWKEVGWTTDPHSYIMAADCFILPNKETYFDLVMLELVSLGAIVIAKNTGGNKYFNTLKPNGIFTFTTNDEACKLVRDIKKYSIEEKENLQRLNREMFEKYFTSEVFAQSYVDLISKL